VKLKEGFMLRNIAGSWIVVPIGERLVEFNGLMTLSESGALLWKLLQEGADFETLVKAITSEYDIDEETARKDVEEFTSAIREKGLIV